jgi:hypothetical protein
MSLTDEEKIKKAKWYAQRIEMYGRSIFTGLHGEGEFSLYGCNVMELAQDLAKMLDR